MRDPNALFLFIWILVSVDRLTGKWKIGRFLLSEITGMNPNTIKGVLRRLQFRHHIITNHPTNKYTEISVSKWYKYQQTIKMTPSKTPSGHQQDTTYQELENKRIDNTNKERTAELRKKAHELTNKPL